MQYCKSCILPDTRTNLAIMEDGVCNACHSWFAKKDDIDWEEREKQFGSLVKSIKSTSNKWDCVIPVSGGKDSTWQVIKALEYGLKPLCVTWRTPVRNAIGQKNLDNLIQLGVDHIDFSINPKVEKALTLKTFKKAGSLAIPMHMALFAIPLQTAISYKIPLVLWGENSGMEYGGSKESLLGFKMTQEWLKTYGVTQGTIAHDWVDDDLSLKDLSSYIWPTDKEMECAGVTASFLGWYFPWDPHETYRVAKENGFVASTDAPKTGLYDFADIDDEFIITIHHWLKWYKFGFTRLWDNLSLEIRMGRITRDTAIDRIKEQGEEYPREAIEKFCNWSGIDQGRFEKIVHSFRNHNVWVSEQEKWKIKDFLIRDWKWY